MKQKIDLVGKRFGRLTVNQASSTFSYGNGEVIWQCYCDCGNICQSSGYLLRNGSKLSCGCLWKPTESELVKSMKLKLETNSKWENGCQLWTGTINRKGIGKTHLTEKTLIEVPKLAWLIHVGKIMKGYKVIHQCENKLCFNIHHLNIELI